MTLSCRADGTFTILQLTDFHVDADADLAEETWRAAHRLIEREQPQFIAYTGDMWCGDSDTADAPRLFDDTLARMIAPALPWAFCWGNHDWYDDLPESQAMLAGSVDWALTDGDGMGNGHAEIVHEGRPVWDVYFLNSGQYWGEWPAVEWFAEHNARMTLKRGAKTPALLFVHIPFGVYERARLSNAYSGVANEEVLCWGDEENVLADAIAGLGTVRACFCGHSHVNDFVCEHRGIRFAYGRSTGYGGYGDLKKGAKRIVLHRDGRVSDETIFP